MRSEFWWVIPICFAPQIVSAGAAILRPRDHPDRTSIRLTPPVVLRTVALELIGLAIAFWILHARHWPLASLGWQVSGKGTFEGILLFAAALAMSSLLGWLWKSVRPGYAAPRVARVAVGFAILLALVNPVFEELLESGYMLNSLQSFGMWPAILASAIFVALLHAYLGWEGAAGVLLVRVLFGLAYWRWRELWPLVLAHVALDFLALAY